MVEDVSGGVVKAYHVTDFTTAASARPREDPSCEIRTATQFNNESVHVCCNLHVCYNYIYMYRRWTT